MTDDDRRRQIVDTRLDSLGDATDRLETVLGIDDMRTVDDADAGNDVLARLDAIENRLTDIEAQLAAIQDLGREKSTKEEKIAALVQFAQNRASDPQTERVALEVADIKGTTGVSRRYAYDLLEDVAADYEWAMQRSNISQYGDLEIDKDGQNAALVIDLDALHTDDEAVNKFTTRTSRKGASA